MSDFIKIKEIIPKNGIVFNEKIDMPHVLCKPKILPLKSVTLKKLEEMERNFEEANSKTAKK